MWNDDLDEVDRVVKEPLLRVEEARDREGGARERDHDRVELADARAVQQRRVQRVVQQVVLPAAAALAVVVDLCAARVACRELGGEPVGASVRAREEVEAQDATARVGLRFGEITMAQQQEGAG